MTRLAGRARLSPPHLAMHDRRSTDSISFIHELGFEDLPTPVVAQTKRCVLDLVGVAAGGRRTSAADIACRFATRQLNTHERGARILFDGRAASPAGAAYAGATTIDSLDAHDGHPLTKGHAGAALLPALFAMIDAEKDGTIDGRTVLAVLAMGYEIAIRAGIAMHASAPDYHTSGAWNALGCAAVAARWRTTGTSCGIAAKSSIWGCGSRCPMARRCR